jgi:hypothetical protein
MNKKIIGLSVLFLVLAVPFFVVNCGAVLIISRGEPLTPGYWKNHPEAWHTQSVVIGGVTYTQAQAIDLLGSNARDATYKLASHLIAAKLNAASSFYGANNPGTIWTVIENADAFLTLHPLGSNPQGADRNYALSLKDTLEAFNQS